MVKRMQSHPLTRRVLLASPLVVLLPGCGTPLPLGVSPKASAEAQARLMDSARVHGWDAYRQLADINVGYDGQWRPLINRIQPVVVDEAYRGAAQDRLLPAQGVVAQAYRGTQDKNKRKQVFWRRGGGGASGEVGVWYDGQPTSDTARLAASALVAECYGLFLLGPLWLAGRNLPAELSGTERVHGRLCDRVQLWMRPGLGQVAQDRVTLLVDRDDSITRRLRFTLEGFASTRGAVAEVDLFEHQRRFGVLWPMRSYEEVVHPLRLPAHDWYVTGLDVNRGHGIDALRGPVFTGAAAAPAAALQ
jgi:hypothetical protein